MHWRILHSGISNCRSKVNVDIESWSEQVSNSKRYHFITRRRFIAMSKKFI